MIKKGYSPESTSGNNDEGCGRSVVGSKPTFYQFDVCVLNIPPTAFKEETALKGKSKYETRAILRKLADQVRWHKLNRVVIAGTAWYFPPEDCL